MIAYDDSKLGTGDWGSTSSLNVGDTLGNDALHAFVCDGLVRLDGGWWGY